MSKHYHAKMNRGTEALLIFLGSNLSKKNTQSRGCYSVPKDSNKPPSGTSQGLAICGIVETGSNAPEDEEGQPRSNRKKRRNDKINR